MRLFEEERIRANGKEYPVRVEYANRRSGSATLKDGTVVIRVPRFIGRWEGRRMLENLKRRMAKALDKHPERFGRERMSFGDGDTVLILGKEYRIFVDSFGASNTRVSAEVDGSDLRIRLPTGLPEDDAREIADRKLVTLVGRVSMPALIDRVGRLNPPWLDSKVSRVRVKNLLSRWGSYSPRTGTVVLNVKLLTAPDPVIDYVIVHELCHFRFRNHGPRFWDLVERSMPDYKEQRRWLRKYGDRLGTKEPVALPVPTA